MTAQPTRAQRRRAALVEVVAAILDAGEPTRFAHEGACIAGLRAGLCLAHWPWRAADDYAAGVVADAFKRMGVARPRWIDGQPEVIEPIGGDRYACARCGKPLPDDMPAKGRNRKYCSTECKQNQAAEARRRDGYRQTAAERAAALAAKMTARLARPCRQCGKPINRKEEGAAFCSRRCCADWQRGRKQ